MWMRGNPLVRAAQRQTQPAMLLNFHVRLLGGNINLNLHNAKHQVMVSLISVGYLLTSVAGHSTEVSSLGFLCFPDRGPHRRQWLHPLCLYSTYNTWSWLGLLVPVLNTCKKLKAQQSLPVPQRQPRKKWPRKMHEGRSHTPLTSCLSNSRKSTSKVQQKLFSTEILWNHQYYSIKQLKQNIRIHTFERSQVTLHSITHLQGSDPKTSCVHHNIHSRSRQTDETITRGSIFFPRHI